MKTVLVTNIKGGVAKSSTAVALAAGLKLADKKAKVLLIDGDPQGSIKTYFGLKLPVDNSDFTSFLIEGKTFSECVLTVESAGIEFDVAVSSRDLAQADLRMAGFHRREETLKNRFKKSPPDYDYCVIDSSPSMSLVLLNFMTFADAWLIPATMDAFAISNIGYLFEQKRIVEEFYDKTPRILGILPTMFDGRTVVAQQALAAVQTKFKNLCPVFEPIGVDAAMKKAQIQRQLIYSISGSRASEAYKKLSQHVAGVL